MSFFINISQPNQEHTIQAGSNYPNVRVIQFDRVMYDDINYCVELQKKIINLQIIML
jgi:hypothetical protein